MTLKSDEKFKENLIFGFKYDMRNLVSFHPTTQKWFHKNFTLMGSWMRNLASLDPTLKSLKICTLMGSFRPKYKMFELKMYRGVMCYYTKDRFKL